MTPFSSVQDEMAKLLADANAAVFTPSAVESLIEVMRRAQVEGISLMKVTMQDGAWVILPFNPWVTGGNRSDALAATGETKCP